MSKEQKSKRQKKILRKEERNAGKLKIFVKEKKIELKSRKDKNGNFINKLR